MYKIVIKLLMLTVAVLSIFATTASAQVPAVERPDIRTGDSWEYSFRDTSVAKPGCNYSLTIKEVTNDKIIGSAERPAGCDASAFANPTYNKDFNFLIPGGTPYRAYSFPLEIGKTWNYEYDFSIGNRSWSNKLTGKIVAAEKVTVPAGTFDAIKIVLDRKYWGSGGPYLSKWAGTVEDTLWYSPVVKNFVKRTYVDSYSGANVVVRELLSYKVQ